MILALLLVLTMAVDPGPLVDRMAQDHADRMVNQDPMVHSNIAPLFESRGGPCEWAGEVMYSGTDRSGDERWGLYAQSPAHAATVAIPRTHHGVGKAVSESGRVVFVDIFCRVAAEPEQSEPEPQVMSTQVSAPERVLVTKAPPLCPAPVVCVE